MYLDYDVLKRYCDNGNKIGDWNGKGVYVSTSDLLEVESRSNYYILYDDGNKLVGFINGYWQVVGCVSSRGSVMECSRYKYEFPNEKMNSKSETKNSNEKMNSKNENEMKNSNEEIIGDVRLGLIVDETLQSARNMTIDSLLVGFNYGLVEAVG
jgi:hypothetical protein